MITEEFIPNKAMFKIADVAVLLGVPKSRVYAWIQYGNLHAEKLGGIVRVPRESVLEYIENNGKQVNKSEGVMKARMSRCLRGRFRMIVKGIFKKSFTSMELLGCSSDEFICHIEKQFKPGMSWKNYGRSGWHIDHIIPIAQFDLSRPYHQKVCFHYTNLQPLWEKENIKKGRKVSRINVAKYFMNFRKAS